MGEAAHIHGANPKSARYRIDMTDGGRAEPANGIWLCCNCHTLVDNDASKFSAEMLFARRLQHEKFVAEQLGRTNDYVRLQANEASLPPNVASSPLARQIAIAKDDFWEYRLTAELLRQALELPSRKWNDLCRNLYTRKFHIVSEDQAVSWFSTKFTEAMSFAPPLTSLYTSELKEAWGEEGIPGDVNQISHVCDLIGAMGEELVRWEEDVRFSKVPEQYDGLRRHIQGASGHQLKVLEAVPKVLDAGIDQAEASVGQQTAVEHTIVFALPLGWEEGISRELSVLRDHYGVPLEEEE